MTNKQSLQPDALDGAGFQSQHFFVENIEWTLRMNCLEMFAGPGYIGKALLEEGIVNNLAFADINPKAVEYCKNNYPLCQTFLSDCFDNVEGQYDLIVGNPPWHRQMPYAYNYQTIQEDVTSLKAVDEDWKIHEKFFSQAIDYLTDDGIIILIESAFGSSEDIFKPMAEKHGLELFKHHYAGFIHQIEPTYFCYYRKP